MMYHTGRFMDYTGIVSLSTDHGYLMLTYY